MRNSCNEFGRRAGERRYRGTSRSSFIISKMSEVPVPEEKSTARPRPRLLWTLLGAMVLVGLLPLVISHYFLIGINRESLETLEKKYLTRSAVGIADDIQNLLSSTTEPVSYTHLT